MSACYFDKLTDLMCAGVDSDAAKQYADQSQSLPSPTAEDILAEYRGSYSEENYDLLFAALKYALPRLSKAERQHVAEILDL